MLTKSNAKQKEKWRPTRKMVAQAASTIIVAVAAHLGLELSAEFSAALAVLIGFGVGFATNPDERDGIEVSPK